LAASWHQISTGPQADCVELLVLDDPVELPVLGASFRGVLDDVCPPADGPDVWPVDEPFAEH